MARVLLTGASGYVGGRLLDVLESAHVPVRCLARRPEFLRSRVAEATEVVAGDVLDARSLAAALEGVDVAYYLVHSMGASGDFEDQDRKAARIFGQVAHAAGVRRIVYLGGLGDDHAALSAHLRSRHEVGQILGASGVPVVVELRASVVIGAWSLSFELIRALVERLPVMITPRWVEMPTQPIAIADLLQYLVLAMDVPASGHSVFEIGGADAVSYGDLMREYARQRRLKRVLIAVPVLSPRLSSLWLALVTPVYARVGRKLVESLRHATVVRDHAAQTAFAVTPMDHRRAIATALRDEDARCAHSRWLDSSDAAGAQPSWGGVRFGNRLVDRRTVRTPAPAATAFAPIRRIGGRTGWYCVNWMWGLRGLLDLMVGGVGLRRGRRDPDDLHPGDVIDFWRVEAYEPEHRLRLAAEMKLPGRAWLELEVLEDEEGTFIQQTATFDPVGLAGLLYWYALYPVHQLIFAGMLRRIREAGLQPSLRVARHT